MIPARTRIGLIATPPYMPECRSLLGPWMVSSSPRRPRSMVTMAGVFEFEQPGVADQRHIGAQLIGVFLHERDQRGRAGFLFALKKDRQAAGQGAMHGFPCAAGLKKRHQLAFVIRRSAPADHSPLAVVSHLRIKRVTVPQGQRIDRLHVIMAVKQHMRAIASRAPSQCATTIGCPGVGRFSARNPKLFNSSTSQSAARSQSALNAGSVEIEGMRSRSSRRSVACGQGIVNMGQDSVKRHRRLLLFAISCTVSSAPPLSRGGGFGYRRGEVTGVCMRFLLGSLILGHDLYGYGRSRTDHRQGREIHAVRRQRGRG